MKKFLLAAAVFCLCISSARADNAVLDKASTLAEACTILSDAQNMREPMEAIYLLDRVKEMFGHEKISTGELARLNADPEVKRMLIVINAQRTAVLSGSVTPIALQLKSRSPLPYV